LDKISIIGARTHNLKNLSLDLKMDHITCICGPSGSGKSSLAFHTLLTESKRRYLNSFPNDFKFFFDIPLTVDVDEIRPVLPVWGLSQINPVVGARPVVADHLGIHQELEKIFFLAGFPSCATHGTYLLRKKTSDQIIKQIGLKLSAGLEVAHVFVNRERYKEVYGYNSFPVRSLDQETNTVRPYDGDDLFWEVGRYKKNSLSKLSEQLEGEFKKFESHQLKILIGESLQSLESSDYWNCPKCDFSCSRIASSPFELSPYNPVGACDQCQGHGMKLVYDRDKLVREPELSIKEGAVYLIRYSRFAHYLPMLIRLFKKEKLDPNIPFDDLPDRKWKVLFDGGDQFPGMTSLLEYLETKKYKKNVRIYLRGLQKEVICSQCNASRLSQVASSYTINFANKRWSLQDLILGELNETVVFLDGYKKILANQKKLSEHEKSVLKIVNNLIMRLNVTNDLNLNYLKLNTKVKSLLVGEYQKILLAKILSYEGSGSLFVLDEPSAGLSKTEQKNLFKELKKLKSQGNTILLVDHSETMQELSDEVIIMGPGAGHLGGEIVFQGKYVPKKQEVFKRKKINTSESWPISITVKNSNRHLLQDFEINANRVNIIQGVSSSSFKHDVYTKFLFNLFNDYQSKKKIKGLDVSIKGLDFLKSCYFFDGGIGRLTSRSTIGTATGLSQVVRKDFCRLPVSKALELVEGNFSASSPLGQCKSCEGRGVQTVDMQFLEDIKFVCDDCRGMKIKPFYGSIRNDQWSFHDVMNQPMSKVMSSIRLTPKFQRIFESIQKLNLEYLELDRSLMSLSGGERIRVKLLANLETIQSQNLYIFDNLSLGLSRADLAKVFDLISSMALAQNTFILVDESPYLAKVADKVLKL
jgi:excinuclease ABC subunit A